MSGGAVPVGSGGARSGGSHRVVLIDDHDLLTSALSAALRAEGYEVDVPALDAGIEDHLRRGGFEVALLDLDLGVRGSGEALLPALLEGGSRVLVVSGTPDLAVIGRCVATGAAGWVPKSATFDRLLGAVLDLVEGRPVLTDDARDELLRSWRLRREADAATMAPFARLSARESTVLGHLVAGRSVDRIATLSYVSPATVRTQVRAILVKLGVNSQLEAVAMATAAGWAGDPGGHREGQAVTPPA